MSSSKIVIAHADRDAAYRIAGAMQDLMDPAPDALTLFEEPGSGWRIDAYYGEPPAPPALHAALVAILGSQPLADARIEEEVERIARLQIERRVDPEGQAAQVGIVLGEGQPSEPIAPGVGLPADVRLWLDRQVVGEHGVSHVRRRRQAQVAVLRLALPPEWVTAAV